MKEEQELKEQMKIFQELEQKKQMELEQKRIQEEQKRQRLAEDMEKQRIREEKERQRLEEAKHDPEVKAQLDLERQQITARTTAEYDANLCQICQMPLFEEVEGEELDIFVMGTCSCVYHKECIKPWIKTCIENCSFPIKCPDP